MPNTMGFTTVHVSAKAEKALRQGHPWVYGEEITDPPQIPDGSVVQVRSSKDRYLGTGYYNSNSKLTVRIVSRNANDAPDDAFWARRVRYALSYRKTVMGPDFQACRLIFGDADGFPGVTVDRFGPVLSVQILSLAMEQNRDFWLGETVRQLRAMGETIEAVYERSDSSIRTLEGLEPRTGFWTGEEGLADDTDGHVQIRENGLIFDVDYLHGQKTGFFLDQKYNRQAVARLAPGMKVLDCFTHTGAFALNAAHAGAEHVTAVDVSREALEEAAKNAALNGLQDKVEFLCADVFDLLTRLAEKRDRTYDLIILDPPAFTKSRSTAKDAMRGYKEINMKAMRLLPRGGYLATCSCSHFMQESYFRQMLHDAAQDAGVQLRQIEARQQSPDHPILWNVPESYYLKVYLFQSV